MRSTKYENSQQSKCQSQQCFLNEPTASNLEQKELMMLCNIQALEIGTFLPEVFQGQVPLPTGKVSAQEVPVGMGQLFRNMYTDERTLDIE